VAETTPARPRGTEPSDRRAPGVVGDTRSGGVQGERAGRDDEAGRERLRDEAGDGAGDERVERQPPGGGWRDAGASHGHDGKGGGGEWERRWTQERLASWDGRRTGDRGTWPLM